MCLTVALRREWSDSSPDYFSRGELSPAANWVTEVQCEYKDWTAGAQGTVCCWPVVNIVTKFGEIS
jgi:hypothetical protein